MKKYVFLFIAVIGMYLFQSCDTKKEVLKDVPADKLEKTFTINMTDTLKIEMKTNPTTGFKWNLVNKIKPNIIEEFDRKYVKDEEVADLVGAGGRDIWRFLPLKTGQVYLHFQYKRENGEAEKDKYFKVVIK